MRKYILFILILSLCLALSACGKKHPSEEGTTEPLTTEATVTIEPSVPHGETQTASASSVVTTAVAQTTVSQTAISTKREPSAAAQTSLPTVPPVSASDMTSAPATETMVVPSVVTTQEKNTITVTLSVSCANAVNAGNEIAMRVAPDGTVFAAKTFEVEKDATVYDLLEKSGLAIGVRSSGYSKYIYSISSLSERDCGSMSGWLYLVNGSVVQKACSQYTLHDGDRVDWVYTLNSGKDVAP